MSKRGRTPLPSKDDPAAKRRKITQKGDPEYWYVDGDVYYPLVEAFKKAGRNDVVIIPPVDSVNVRQELPRYLDGRGVRGEILHQDVTYIVIPYNLGRIHWSALVAHVRRDGVVNRLVWLMPDQAGRKGGEQGYLGAAPAAAEDLRKAVCTYFGGHDVRLEWPGKLPLHQENGNDCGPVTVENVMDYLTNRPKLGKKRSSKGMRAGHLGLLTPEEQEASLRRQECARNGRNEEDKWMLKYFQGSDGDDHNRLDEMYANFLMSGREHNLDEFNAYIQKGYEHPDATLKDWDELQEGVWEQEKREALKHFIFRPAHQAADAPWPQKHVDLRDVVASVIVGQLNGKADDADIDKVSKTLKGARYTVWGQLKAHFGQGEKTAWDDFRKEIKIPAAIGNGLYTIMSQEQGESEWAQLLGLMLGGSDDLGDVFRIPNMNLRLYLNGVDEDSDGIYMRECYKDILGVLWQRIGRVQNSEQNPFRTYVGGTPGVGKSALALLLVRLCVRGGYTVIYHAGDHDVVRFSRDGATSSSFAEQCDVRILDVGGKQGQAPPKEIKFNIACVAFGSPGTIVEKLQEYMKNCKGLSSKIYVPVWSREELLAAAKAAYRGPHENLDKRWRLWGGSARAVLGGVDCEELNLKQHVDSVTLAGLEQLCSSAGATGVGREIRDHLMHLKVSDDYHSFTRIFASKEIAKRLAHAHFRSLCRRGSARLLTSQGTLFGLLFEEHALRYVSKARRISVTALDGKQKKKETLVIPADVEYFFRLDDVARKGSPRLLVPHHQNHHGCDAVLRSARGPLTLLQMTVQQEGKVVKATALKELYKWGPRDGRVRLVIVRPDRPEFRRKGAVKISGDIAFKVEQYVMFIPLPGDQDEGGDGTSAEECEGPSDSDSSVKESVCVECGKPYYYGEVRQIHNICGQWYHSAKRRKCSKHTKLCRGRDAVSDSIDDTSSSADDDSEEEEDSP